MGKMGSAIFSFLSMKSSQTTNATQDITAMTSAQRIAGLDQAYRVPASSSEKTRRMDAVSMSTAPIRSSLRRLGRLNRVRRRLMMVVVVLEAEKGRKKAMSNIAVAPAGALVFVSKFQPREV